MVERHVHTRFLIRRRTRSDREICKSAHAARSKQIPSRYARLKPDERTTMLESHVLPEFSARFGADGNDELNAKRWRLVANWLHLKLLAVLNVIEREHGRTASGELE